MVTYFGLIPIADSDVVPLFFREERHDQVVKAQAAKQKKRTDNIAMRNEKRNDKRKGIKSKIKPKGKSRPGFEGKPMGKGKAKSQMQLDIEKTLRSDIAEATMDAAIEDLAQHQTVLDLDIARSQRVVKELKEESAILEEIRKEIKGKGKMVVDEVESEDEDEEED